ncbi:MAG: hypothetical protein ACREU6_07065, partial [Steroidobacteraceae bacterium]
RKGFIENIDYYDQMGEVAQDALADGLDPYDFADVTRYSQQRCFQRFGHLFRFDEYFAMNLWRYMQQYITGGWGIEGNFRPNTTPF